jgi:hypothetical protein
MNTNRFRVLPYAVHSKSAKLLAEALGGKRIRLEGSRYTPRFGDVVINWGNSKPPPLPRIVLSQYEFLYLNLPEDIETVANKLYFFQHNEDAPWLPLFWTDPEEIPDEAFPIVCRTVLTGHSGLGIVIATNRHELVPCPLYVKYVPKRDEYRVHLGFDKNQEIYTIAVQQKKRRLDYDEPNWQVRNHANGFVYAREGVNPPAGVLDVAHDCLLHSGLDFGAFDVIWNEHQGRAYVLEVNTAPGLEGQTLDDYINYFKRLV